MVVCDDIVLVPRSKAIGGSEWLMIQRSGFIEPS